MWLSYPFRKEKPEPPNKDKPEMLSSEEGKEAGVILIPLWPSFSRFSVPGISSKCTGSEEVSGFKFLISFKPTPVY